MELHGVAHDVGHLIISPVVHALHRVKYTPLDGFQSVFDVGNGALQDDIRSVVEEPVLIHSAQMVNGSGIETVHGLIVGVGFAGGGAVGNVGFVSRGTFLCR